MNRSRRNLWPLLIAAGLLLFYVGGCSYIAPDIKKANEAAITNERLGSIDNHLSDIHADLQKIANKRLFPLGDEKGAK